LVIGRLSFVVRQKKIQGLSLARMAFNMYKIYFERAHDEKTWKIKISANENKAREWINV